MAFKDGDDAQEPVSLGVSGVWTISKSVPDDCSFSIKEVKKKYIYLLFSSPRQTRWADFKRVCLQQGALGSNLQALDHPIR